MSEAATKARVDAVVSQIAYAQAHGARAVLDEAIQNGGHLSDDVQVYLVEARQVAGRLESLTKTIGVLVGGEKCGANATSSLAPDLPASVCVREPGHPGIHDAGKECISLPDYRRRVRGEQ